MRLIRSPSHMASSRSLRLRDGMNYTHSFWLPFPPSVNRIWRYARGKAHASADYIAWQKQANAAAYAQKLGSRPVMGRHILNVQLSDAFKRRSDVDNRLKAVADFCQRLHLTVNDRDAIKTSI